MGCFLVVAIAVHIRLGLLRAFYNIGNGQDECRTRSK